MAEKRDYQLDGAIASYKKARNLASERRADLVNALKEGKENGTALEVQVTEAADLLALEE